MTQLVLAGARAYGRVRERLRVCRMTRNGSGLYSEGRDLSEFRGRTFGAIEADDF